MGKLISFHRNWIPLICNSNIYTLYQTLWRTHEIDEKSKRCTCCVQCTYYKVIHDTHSRKRRNIKSNSSTRRYIHLMCVTKTIHVWLSWQDLHNIFSIRYSAIHSGREASLFFIIYIFVTIDLCSVLHAGRNISIIKTLFSDFDALSVQRSPNKVLWIFAIFPFIFLISDNIDMVSHQLYNLRPIHLYSLFPTMEQIPYFYFQFHYFHISVFCYAWNVEFICLWCAQECYLNHLWIDWFL